ncbi:MAG: CrcB family protein [Actinomycetota bacterium]
MGRGRHWPAIAAGGAVGSLVRWAVVGLVDDPSWSWPVLAVNTIGGAVLGWLVGRGGFRSASTTAALGVGFCGGLTTMSALAVEVAGLARDDRLGAAAGYLAATLVVGGAAAFAGVTIGRRGVGGRA